MGSEMADGFEAGGPDDDRDDASAAPTCLYNFNRFAKVGETRAQCSNISVCLVSYSLSHKSQYSSPLEKVYARMSTDCFVRPQDLFHF